jgi:hypothetical protein
MSRRPEPAELAAAREQLRVRYEKQQAAAVAFFDASTRLARLRAEADALEAELRGHAATLAEALGVDTAAQVTGWSRGKVAEAERERRPRRPAATAVTGIGAEAVAPSEARAS